VDLASAGVAEKVDPGASGSKKKGDGMREDRHEVDIHVPAPQVLHAFLDVEKLRGWWGNQQGFVEARPGGMWVVTWDVPVEGFGYVALTGTIRSLEAGKRLEIENLAYLNKNRAILGPMSLTVSVTEREGTSHVVVRQAGYQSGGDWDWYYQLVVENWPAALTRLRQFLEGPGH
jgi:uncharacterized protein YndB with AHSA1/START domain